MNKRELSNGQNIFLFFFLAFGFSWIFWIPQALVVNGVSVPTWFAQFLSSSWNPAPFGPLVAALILTLFHDGFRGLWALLKKGVDFRFSKRWLLPIFLLPPLIYGVSLCLAATNGWIEPDAANLANPGLLPVAFIYILFLGGPLQEEFGWRGYALVLLQKRFNALNSSLILGMLWGLWHLPAVFSNTLIVEPRFYPALVVQITLSSVIFTWVYNHTGQSILAVLLLHTMVNLAIWLAVPSMKLPPGFLACSIFLYLIVDLVIICIWGRHSLRQTHW